MAWHPPPFPEELRLLMREAIEKWGEETCAQVLYAAHVLDKPLAILAEEYDNDPHAAIRAAKLKSENR
jgi:hypothetical protein